MFIRRMFGSVSQNRTFLNISKFLSGTRLPNCCLYVTNTCNVYILLCTFFELPINLSAAIKN